VISNACPVSLPNYLALVPNPHRRTPHSSFFLSLYYRLCLLQKGKKKKTEAIIEDELPVYVGDSGCGSATVCGCSCGPGSSGIIQCESKAGLHEWVVVRGLHGHTVFHRLLLNHSGSRYGAMVSLDLNPAATNPYPCPCPCPCHPSL